ncbi:MAG: sortase [Anaerolineae bacterium]|nr:sortase [Anaerolineae bacterium]
MNRRRSRLTFRTFIMLSIELVVLVFAASRLRGTLFPASEKTEPTPTVTPGGLTSNDVLPTPTPDQNTPARLIVFPGASMSAPIIPAGRVGGTWETRHLGGSVGHLVGTSWLDDAGGNIVLAGHVESATGAPGPFAHLFDAQLDDMIILREGVREVYYKVTTIETAAPDDISYVAQDGQSRLTLITCTDWDYERQVYNGRLVVVAEPVSPASTPGLE